MWKSACVGAYQLLHGAIFLLPQWLMAWSLKTLPLQLTSDTMELHWHSAFITEEFE